MAGAQSDDAAPRRRRVFRYPDDRRRDLLDAAVKVFARKGLAQATVADITAEARMSKGAFYLCFSSKEELLAALKQRFADEVVARVTAQVRRIGSEDLWTLADETVDAMVSLHVEQRDLVDVLVREGGSPHTSPVYAEADNKIRQMLAAGIEQGVAAGVFACDDPVTTAGLLMHAVDGVIQHAILYDEPFDAARITRAARQLVRKALAT